MRSTIYIHRDGRWLPAADFEPIESAPLAAKFSYRAEYVNTGDALALSLALPLDAAFGETGAAGAAPACPPFLLDLVPQGPGRNYLLHALAHGETPGLDLVLAQHGAANPIGKLRIDTAVAYSQRQSQKSPPARDEGFAPEEIWRAPEAFIAYLRRDAMLSAGTTGVQGGSPKFLLAQDRAGRWFPDALLADEESSAHWLLKLPRSGREIDATILRNEAAYLRVAHACGIRSGAHVLHGDMLFMRRFDRRVDARGLKRLHQESLASLSGLRTFGVPVSLFDLAAAIARYASAALSELVEFVKRDVLNEALGNCDNHSRNSAMLRLPDGTVELTPLYDFAPMYLDRPGAVRACKWRLGKAHEVLEWDEIIATLAIDEPGAVARGLRDFLPFVENLPALMRECGVGDGIIEERKTAIEAQSRRLARLSV